ncbi:MAG: AAA family ATPase [Candidatus Desulfofervidaceae bacterium]|nr:AAA family ATPase [Candidatus Desulfofervidaceae bacterium]
MIGAEWVRVDLHLHSPASSSFSLPPGVSLNSSSDLEKLAEEYVKKLKEANIKIAAITDYNLIREDFLKKIKQKTNEHNIVILPGIELDVEFAGGKYGLHILLIFDRNEDIDGINRFIYSLDKNPQDDLVKGRKHRSLGSKYELEQLISEIRKRFNCLVIFAHPEDDKGIFKSFDPKQAAKYIKNIKPDAVEKFSDSTKNRLLSTGVLRKEELERIAQIENSDPKSFEEIGNKKREGKIRATYLKLSDFSLDAIELALHDPSVRVTIYSPPEMTHDWITGIKINGSGFLQELLINFNPEMNTLIGGRGVGKSAIIETIRYGLGLQVYSEPEYRVNFVHDVVGSGGIIEIYVQRHYGDQKKNYVIRRTVGKEVEIYDENIDRLNIDVATLFDGKLPIIIGQKELYHVARDHNFRLKLIDELIGEDIKDKQKEFDELVEKLKSNGSEIISLKKKISKKDEYEQELKSIEDEMKIFKELGVVEKLKQLTDTIADDEMIKDGFEKIKEAIDKVQEVKNYLNEELSNLKERLKRSRTHHESIERMQRICEELNKHAISILDTLLREFEKLFEKNYKNEMKVWQQYKLEVEAEVKEIKRQLGSQKLKPERLEELTRRKAILEPRMAELRKVEEIFSKKLKEREKLKNQLKEKRHELFEVRQERVGKINKKLKEKLKLEVRFEEDRNEFEKRLKSVLTTSGIHKNAINNIVNSKLAIDGLLLSEYMQEGKEKIIEKFGLTETMAEKFVAWFSNKERLFELETLFPEDRIIIKLKVDDDFKEIEKLSDGQKATGLLLLLFAQGNRILILDQPEEDLDNRFIYEDVVKILRDYKSKRQFIIATHNANIPVIGDSEQIIVLESEEDRCQIVDTSSVDKESIRNHVKNIMEGGEEAFKLRAEKYGGI